MDLIIHHMFQPLVVGGAKEHLRVQLAAGEAIVEHLVTTEVVVVVTKEVRDLLHVDGVIERSGISDLTLVCRDLQWRENTPYIVLHMGTADHTHLALEALDQVTDGHTGRDGVRINDDIRGNPFTRERHVLSVPEKTAHNNKQITMTTHRPHLLPVSDPAGPLLSVPTGELVPYLRRPHRADLDLAELVAVLVYGQHDLIDDPSLAGTQECAGVSLRVPPGSSFQLCVVCVCINIIMHC